MRWQRGIGEERQGGDVASSHWPERRVQRTCLARMDKSGFKEEAVKVDEMFGHGGLFKTRGVGQSIAAAAINSSVSVMETAGEGGAWGIALLAAYMKNKEDNETLEAYLNNKIFAGQAGSKLEPKAEDVAGFEKFMKRYMAGLSIEHAAVDSL